jgi:hypothetical protein
MRCDLQGVGQRSQRTSRRAIVARVLATCAFSLHIAVQRLTFAIYWGFTMQHNGMGSDRQTLKLTYDYDP